jgi:hypothetical protein
VYGGFYYYKVIAINIGIANLFTGLMFNYIISSKLPFPAGGALDVLIKEASSVAAKHSYVYLNDSS